MHIIIMLPTPAYFAGLNQFKLSIIAEYHIALLPKKIAGGPDPARSSPQQLKKSAISIKPGTG